MKDEWYGDARDLVKWGVLLNLAYLYSAKRIVHVAYFRRSEWSPVTIGGRERPIPNCVLKHFRNVRRIEELEGGPHIEILSAEFKVRDDYGRKIVQAIAVEHPCIVFLDPDTGLEPPRSALGLEHVSNEDAKYVWDNMRVGDMIVLYQHRTNRKGQDWIQPKRRQFAKALDLPYGRVKVAEGRHIASDVVLYYCSKESG